MMEMPPLPTPGMRAEHWSAQQTVAYTPNEMLAYGESCARMAREEERERIAAKWEEAHGFDKYGVAAAIRAG